MQSNHCDQPIATEKRMLFDDLAWAQSDNIANTWRDTLFSESVLREIGHCIIKHRGGPAEELFNPQKGSFNVLFRMKFLDGGSAIIRFLIPGVSMFAEEKLQREVSVMRFIERHTSIRVPHVLHYGTADQSLAGLGPFIVMEYIENDSDLVDALNTPGLSDDERKSFSEIGCIARNREEEDDFDDEWTTLHRPLTINMNELVQLGGVPPHLLPQTTFKTTSSYLLALAEMHLTHLSMLRNDAIESSEDCRRKYIARCLFRKLARENKLLGFLGVLRGEEKLGF